MPQLDEIAIRMASAFNAKNVNDLVSPYDQAAILMPPGEPAVEGKSAIQQWFAAALIRLGTIQIVADRDVCV
jgi:ketosteroid isomerase-like protein